MSNAYMSRICMAHHSTTTLSSHSNGRVLSTRFLKSFSSVNSLTPAPSPSSSTPFISSQPSSLIISASRTTPSPSPSGTPPPPLQQRSEEWFSLRKDRLTTSTFSTALGFWKGTRRPELWHEKVFSIDPASDPSTKLRAMEWGVTNENAAIERYKTITGNDVASLGFAIHSEEKLYWLGASPDGILGCFGILEVKCPYNKGKPELALPWSKMPFYYMPQIQGQMEIMDRDWVDLYCWTPSGSTIFRVYRDRAYWDMIHGVLSEFWWEHVVPAREVLLTGKVEDEVVSKFKPGSVHRRTGQIIVSSVKLAAAAKLMCREISGHVEFYR